MRPSMVRKFVYLRLAVEVEPENNFLRSRRRISKSGKSYQQELDG